jgi:hypothetical protein
MPIRLKLSLEFVAMAPPVGAVGAVTVLRQVEACETAALLEAEMEGALR